MAPIVLKGTMGAIFGGGICLTRVFLFVMVFKEKLNSSMNGKNLSPNCICFQPQAF